MISMLEDEKPKAISPEAYAYLKLVLKYKEFSIVVSMTELPIIDELEKAGYCIRYRAAGVLAANFITDRMNKVVEQHDKRNAEKTSRRLSSVEETSSLAAFMILDILRVQENSDSYNADLVCKVSTNDAIVCLNEDEYTEFKRLMRSYEVRDTKIYTMNEMVYKPPITGSVRLSYRVLMTFLSKLCEKKDNDNASS